MSIKVAIEHRTTYRFDALIGLDPHVIRLRPAPHCRTPIESYSLSISPAEHFINWQQDPFGNYLARVVFPERARELEVTVGLVANLQVINPFDFFIEEYAENFPFAYDAALKADLEPYLRPVDETPGSGPGPLLRDWMSGLDPLPDKGMPTVDFLVAINSQLYRDVAYSVRMEVGVQTPDETLRRAIGSCRDSSWLLVSVLRELGLAARFVSGYLIQLAADQESLDGPSGPTEDFTDLHAWAEVFVPGAGWIGLDPTSALFAGEGHIPLSATPHPSSAAAITGSTAPAGVEFDFANTVRRIHEDPRVTKPYTEQQWQQVDALGQRVDELLTERDVRLTMGGEPTFVSVDDMTSEQWTVAADGEDKRAMATDLAARLHREYAGGGIVQRGQGKWYPGEVLPRWQISLIWRSDGVPMWQDPELLADPWRTEDADPDAGLKAKLLAAQITAAFGLPPEQCLPAFEDALAKLASDVRRPAGAPPDVDPLEVDGDLLADLDAGVTTPAAWVLPIHPAPDDDGWASPRWSFRRGRLVLIGGDSPAGLRLPLDSISWVDPEPQGEPSYLDGGGPLAVEDDPRARIVEVEGAPPTAIAVQARDGFVFVFLPPLDELEHFLELVALVERSAVGVGTRIVLEGYGPPPDSRIKLLAVTPDPGVIEVNLQPTDSWSALRSLTETLYDAARETRLGTETFDLDGTHGGTGGGNHITLGGSVPKDSPLLRRPDLLVSLLSYWQHHPSLSYLFSGRFIGPTSQAPRVDEGRAETLYELEIAFAEIERLTHDDGHAPPWMVDRALRHLLTDLTGNTHRAEFCIDKLYSPDTSRGRLGLLELRGFEMPPHPQMALVQALLVRALVARFWDEPYTKPLIRWGTELHERFLLPHWASTDIAEVVTDLRAHGIAFDPSWLDPFTEFRFPRIGSVQIEDIRLELRAAIEPWNVLGEESALTGTARYVDSSTEKLQVRAEGITAGRHIVTCNGVPVPLMATGITGTQVAGVRFRAWQPFSALHPTIEVQSPLVFDVIDLANSTSLGGCTYHVVHPGGRSYDLPPVNANVAESRRSRRFEAMGHSSGPVDAAALLSAVGTTVGGVNEYPHTLDLRRRTPRAWGRP